jgi:hypothetical protein
MLAINLSDNFSISDKNFSFHINPCPQIYSPTVVSCMTIARPGLVQDKRTVVDMCEVCLICDCGFCLPLQSAINAQSERRDFFIVLLSCYRYYTNIRVILLSQLYTSSLLNCNVTSQFLLLHLIIRMHTSLVVS